MRCPVWNIATLLVVFSTALSASHSWAQRGSVAAEVSAAEDALNKAIDEGDWTRIKSMMTANHIEVTPSLSGQASMDTVIQAVTSGDYSQRYLGDRQVVELGEGVAILTQEKEYKGRMGGVPLPPKVRFAAIWVKVDGVWKQTYYQETAVFESPPADQALIR